MEQHAQHHWTVDAHHHFWTVGNTQHDWSPEPTRAIDRDFTPDDLATELGAAEVDATVVVQAANTLAETRQLLDHAATTPYVAGVVGWVPLDDPTRTADELDRLAADEHLVGIRHLINTEPDPDWIVREGVLRGLQVVASRGLAYDAVPVNIAQLEHTCTVAERVPDLRIVVDHLAKPPLLEQGWQPWAGLLERLASHPNVAVKVSVGLDVVTTWGRWDLGELRPYLDHALHAFGPARSMAASNWPVVLLAGEYADVWGQTREGLSALSASEQAAVLGGTAARWYALPAEVSA